MPIKRQEPTTSAARIAANRRSTCSLLKMHPRGSGKTECPIAQLWADVRLCPCPRWVCAVTRRRFPVGANPTRQPLQPEAIGAVMEATKWLKPSISVSRIGDSASVQGNYGDSALNASSSFIEIVRRSVSDGLHHENGGFPTSIAYSEVARPKRFELLTPQIRSLVKGPEEMAHRPN